MAYQVRELNDADWPEVSRIYQAGIDTNLATLQAECPAFSEWDASHVKACRRVATEGGADAGFAALTAVSGRCVYAGVAEVSIYIAPEHRGRGAGGILLQELIFRSERSGFWTLQSAILQENSASILLHKSCGFRVVGYRERIGRDRFGKWRNTVLMERRSLRDDFEG